jgi:hypothetical protein
MVTPLDFGRAIRRQPEEIICPNLGSSFVVVLKPIKNQRINSQPKNNMNIQNQNGYMLLYRSSEWYKTLSQEELQKLINQNKAWFERLTSQGKAKPGRALERTGVTVSGKNGRFVIDGPFAESKEAIGGYLMLDVETIEEAIAIAQGSPSLAYGGSIEVRPVAEECPLDIRARELAREEQLVNA